MKGDTAKKLAIAAYRRAAYFAVLAFRSAKNAGCGIAGIAYVDAQLVPCNKMLCFNKVRMIFKSKYQINRR